MLIQGWGQFSLCWLSCKMHTKAVIFKLIFTEFQLIQFLNSKLTDPNPGAHSDCHTETRTQTHRHTDIHTTIKSFCSQKKKKKPLKYLIWLLSAAFKFFLILRSVLFLLFFSFCFFRGRFFFFSLNLWRKFIIETLCLLSLALCPYLPSTPQPYHSTKQSLSRSISRFSIGFVTIKPKGYPVGLVTERSQHWAPCHLNCLVPETRM